MKKDEKFLMAAVNIDCSGGAHARERAADVLQKFDEYFPATLTLPITPGDVAAREAEEKAAMREIVGEDILGPPIVEDDIRTDRLQSVWNLAVYLQLLWIEPDPELREWLIFTVRRDNAERLELRKLPPPTPFERAMRLLKVKVKSFRVCRNPDCKMPYFIGPHRKPLTYCSARCFKAAKQAAKRDWWRANRGKGAAAKKEQRT
jgi:hypothetical protein